MMGIVDMEFKYARRMEHLQTSEIRIILKVTEIISKAWVFSQSKYSDTKAFLLFSLIGLIGLGLNEVIMFVCTGLIGFWYILSKVISTGIVFVFNFVARKLLIF